MRAPIAKDYGIRKNRFFDRMLRSLAERQLRMKIESGVTVDAAGTSKQGEVLASYDELVALFGEPSEVNVEPGYDGVTIAWDVKIDDDVVTVYDLRDFVTARISSPYLWNVGGRNRMAVGLVESVLSLGRLAA